MICLLSAIIPLLPASYDMAPEKMDETILRKSHYSLPISQSGSYFRAVFVGQRGELGDFIRLHARELREKVFFELVDDVLKDPELQDGEIYRRLYEKMGAAHYGKYLSTYYREQATKVLKRDLARQLATLMGPKHPLPTDTLPPEGQTSNIALFVDYTGLHSRTPEEASAYVAAIWRALKPGGSFVLREHDAQGPAAVALAEVSYCVNHLACGVSPEEHAKQSYRFYALETWIALIEKAGFTFNKTHPPLIRKGDITQNALIRFDKP